MLLEISFSELHFSLQSAYILLHHNIHCCLSIQSFMICILPLNTEESVFNKRLFNRESLHKTFRYQMHCSSISTSPTYVLSVIRIIHHLEIFFQSDQLLKLPYKCSKPEANQCTHNLEMFQTIFHIRLVTIDSDLELIRHIENYSKVTTLNKIMKLMRVLNLEVTKCGITLLKSSCMMQRRLKKTVYKWQRGKYLTICPRPFFECFQSTLFWT